MCAICMDDFTQKEAVCELSCHKKHIFHVDCLEQWFNSQVSASASKLVCPICKTALHKVESDSYDDEQ